MADDPILPTLGTRIVRSREGLRQAANQEDLTDQTIFVPPTPDELDTEQFRTEESRELSGLVQELASARVDAANRAQQIREEATRQTRANLFNTVGAQGLTQALTGLDVGAAEQTAQAQQTLRQAQEAERKAETQAEKVEETAPLQADIKSDEIIQQDKQNAQKRAQTKRAQEVERLTNAADRLSEAAARNVDSKQSLAIMQQEHQNRMEVLDKKFRNELSLLGAESSMTGEETSQVGQTLTESLATLDVAKNQIDRLYSKLQTEEGFFGGESQTIPNDAITSAKNIGEVINRMTTGRGMSGVLDAKEKLKQNGIWSALPQEKRQKLNGVIGIAQNIGGLSEDASTSEFADALRASSDRYREIQDFSPMGALDQETVGSVTGAQSSASDSNTEDTSSESGGQNTSSGGGADPQVNRFDQNLDQTTQQPSSFERDFDARQDRNLSGGTQSTQTSETNSGPSAGGRSESGGSSNNIPSVVEEARGMAADLPEKATFLADSIENFSTSDNLTDTQQRTLEEDLSELRSMVNSESTRSALAEDARRTEERQEQEFSQEVETRIRNNQDEIAQRESAIESLEQRMQFADSEEEEETLQSRIERERTAIENAQAQIEMLRTNPSKIIDN